MDPSMLQALSRAVSEIAAQQHGVVSRVKLLDLGYRPDAIQHRLETGRLHRVHLGVYALGRPELSLQGRWVAALLSCGPAAMLSHDTAAAHYGIRPLKSDPIEISVPEGVVRRRAGVVVHRRAGLSTADAVEYEGMPLTSLVLTFIDIAAVLERGPLEAAINDADKRDLIDPEQLRSLIDEAAPHPGIRNLRETLDRRTFALTDSELERRFLAIVRRTGLAVPETGRQVNGFKTDFFWPELGLVVETDGLRFHRTAAQQAKDRLRDQVHTAVGLTALRFTHSQVTFEPQYVSATLIDVTDRLNGRGSIAR